jgi:hypothetical protein
MSLDPETIEQRLDALERTAVRRTELRDEIKRAAQELRDDSDFSRPYWQIGADTATEHLVTRASRKLLIWVVGAIGAAALLWLGSLGVFFR